jgi:hypothetical protein
MLRSFKKNFKIGGNWGREEMIRSQDGSAGAGGGGEKVKTASQNLREQGTVIKFWENEYNYQYENRKSLKDVKSILNINKLFETELGKQL